MVAMKNRFSQIITELDENYTAIEAETTTQFKAFVAQLKSDMEGKVSALSQVHSFSQ
jgi:hypothetical protein